MRISADPTFRLIGSKKNWDRGAALTSRLQSFETGILASDENLIGLMAINRELVAQAEAADDSERVGSTWTRPKARSTASNRAAPTTATFELVWYHPLLLFNQHGDCLAAKLRPGHTRGSCRMRPASR